MLKLLPSWITSARKVEPTSTAAYACSPVDCEPIEKMSFLDGLETLEKGEDNCWPCASITSQLRQLSGVGGEGDRKSGARSPLSQAFFTPKPPTMPLWLMAIETTLPSEPPTQPSKQVNETVTADSPQAPQSLPRQVFTTSSDSTKINSKLRIHRRDRRLKRERVIESPLLGSPPVAAVALATPSLPRLLGLQTREVCEPNQTPTSSTSVFTCDYTYSRSVTAAPSLQLVPDSPAATTFAASYPRTTTDDCRSIAVQAHLFQEAEKTSKLARRCRRSPGPEEWVGGARALRDSHVRLVVRQLRHIELLNRAIDGLAPSDASDDTGTAAQAPAAVGCLSNKLVL